MSTQPSESSIKNDGIAKKSASKFSGTVSFRDVFSIDREKGLRKISDLTAKTVLAKKFSDNRILGALSDFDAARLLSHLDFVFLNSGEELSAAGEFNRYVYFPETAVISEIHDLADGSTIETALIGIEGATGLSAILGAKPLTYRALTTIEGNAWRIKADILRQEFARAEKLQTLLLDFVSGHINQISQRLICKSFHLLEKRLCGWLLMLRDRVKNNRLKLTQETAALLLGAHRPSITIAAQTLRNKGLIDYSRGDINILDRQGLKNSACECYSALQLNHSDW